DRLPRPHRVERDRAAPMGVGQPKRGGMFREVLESLPGRIPAKRSPDHRPVLRGDPKHTTLGPRVRAASRQWAEMRRALQLPPLIANTCDIQKLILIDPPKPIGAERRVVRG